MRCECGRRTMTATIQAHPKAGPSVVRLCVFSHRPPSECEADSVVHVVRKRDAAFPTWEVRLKSTLLGLIWTEEPRETARVPFTWSVHRPTYQTGVSGERNEAVKEILRRAD